MAKSMRAAVPNKNDEMYTPPKLVKILLPYLDKMANNKIMMSITCPVVTETKKQQALKQLEYKGHGYITVWCPFDTEESEYVRILRKEGYDVISSHLSEGKDFFSYQPERPYDCIISNPPFSKKLDVFKKLFELHKPFAMLVNVMAINYQEIGYFFAEHPVQMLVPDKRVSFNGKPSSFCSGYVCSGMLNHDLVFCHVEDNNVGKNFEPAEMYKEKI